MSTILLVDDQPIENAVLKDILLKAGYEVTAELNPERAISLVQGSTFDLVISDLSMAGKSGIELVQNLHRIQPGLAILVMTDSGTIENAVIALKEGAFDCLKKPFLKDEFLLSVHRTIRNSTLARENTALREKMQGNEGSQS